MSRIRHAIALFVAGFFFGGVVDHVIFSLRGVVAPYGLRLGVTGNWLMAAFDALVTVLFIALARRWSLRSS